MNFRRIALFAALSLSTVAVCAQQPSPEPPQTLAQANLVITQQQQQISELALRVAELEAAFVSPLTKEREQLAQGVKVAQNAVAQEQAAKAAQEAAAKAKAAPAVAKH